MRATKLLAALVFITAFSQLAPAQCRRPKGDDVPHGANESVFYEARSLSRLRGRVFFPDYTVKSERTPAKDIVVEVYSYGGGGDSYEDVNRVLSGQKRIAACLTDSDGRFSFDGLKPGRYLFRAGTREPNQFNEAFGIVILGRARGKRKGLEIVLTLGT